MAQFTHTFEIDKAIDPKTERPFGSRYAGEFVVRRPSIGDKAKIELKFAAGLTAMGLHSREALQGIDKHVLNVDFIFCHLDVLAEKRPAWAHPEKLWADEEEGVVYAIWREIDTFIESFRPKPSAPTEEKG